VHSSVGYVDRRVWSIYGTDRVALGAFRVGYALAWFLVNDRVKLAAYNIFDKQGGGLITHFWGKNKQHSGAK
jgi:hypothetical protein